jgi:hypothetical protein
LIVDRSLLVVHRKTTFGGANSEERGANRKHVLSEDEWIKKQIVHCSSFRVHRKAAFGGAKSIEIERKIY